MATYFIVTTIIVAIILLLRFINKKEPIITRKKSEMIVQNLEANPIPKEAQELYELLKLTNQNKGGTDQDVIPEGYGEFGLEVTNPIPVNTIFGSNDYLKRLRTLEGKPVQNNRTGSIGARNIEDLIDEYEISVDGQFITHIYICSEHKKNSERAPKGFKLSSIPFL